MTLTMKTITQLPPLLQGDLLLVTLTGSKLKSYKGKPTVGRGWLLINEISINGEIISGNFCPEGQQGYGAVTWPEAELHAFLRGKHGQVSPFAALLEVFGSKCIAVALT